jgi:hypothetical protein
MLGFRSFDELHKITGSVERSLGDAFVDNDTRQACYNQQVSVLTMAGIELSHATAIINEIRPTDYGSTQVKGREDATSVFEAELGLRRSN